MTSNTTKTKVFTTLMGGAAALVITVTGLASAPAAFAQTPAPTPAATAAATARPSNADDKGAKLKAHLAKAFANEQKALTKQQANLTKAQGVAGKVETRIDKLQKAGKNLDGLRVALNTFKSQLANAEAQHDTASKILARHTGFDANGAVTDIETARQTVKDGAQSLHDARGALKQALLDIRQALRQSREAKPATASDVFTRVSYQVTPSHAEGQLEYQSQAQLQAQYAALQSQLMQIRQRAVTRQTVS